MIKRQKIDWAKVKFYIIILIILISTFSYIWFSIKGYNPYEEAKLFSQDGAAAPIIFIALFIISAFFPLPLLTILGATLFSFWEVLIYSVIGSMLNAFIVFYLARWLGRDFVKRSENKYKTIKKLDLKFKKNALKDIILLRLFSVIPPELINLSAGLSGISSRDYFWGSLFGFIPASLAAIMVVKSKLAGNNTLLTLSMIFFIILLLIPIIYLSAARKFSREKYQKAKKIIGLKI